MWLAIVGFAMILSIVYLLLKNKSIPVVIFIVIPLVAAFLAGFSIPEISEYVKKGVSKTTTVAVLFVFSITFFGIMSDTGMFDTLISKLTKKAGKNVIVVALISGVVAICAHLDGATVTTVLVTIPAMLPLYKKLNIRPQLLLLITASAMGVMNLLPWGGPLARTAIVLKMDINELWHHMIPIQIAGIATTLILAFVMILKEIKFHGAGKVLQGHIDITQDVGVKEDENELRRPKLFWFNISLTVAVLALLLTNIFPFYFVFMIGLAIALIVNYPGAKAQKARIRAHAPACLEVVSVMLSAGVLVGILTYSEILTAMTLPILHIVPDAISSYLHLIMGFFALPLGMVLGTDSYFYGLMPLVIEVGKNYELAPLTVASTMLIGKNIALLISPLVPATYLAIGFANVELKDHIKYSFFPLWIASVCMIIFGVIIGLIPV